MKKRYLRRPLSSFPYHSLLLWHPYTMLSTRKSQLMSRFPPELILELSIAFKSMLWKGLMSHKSRRAFREALRSCCLVCRRWNYIFTPVLYHRIYLDGDKPSNLLRRTLWHDRHDFTRFVRHMYIDCTSAPSAWTVMMGKLPSLQTFTICHLDILDMHLRFERLLNMLPNTCKVYCHFGMPIQHGNWKLNSRLHTTIALSKYSLNTAWIL